MHVVQSFQSISPVEDACFVHVVHGFDQLVHVAPDTLLCNIVAAASDELIDVHVHQLKHQRQPPCWLVTAWRRTAFSMTTHSSEAESKATSAWHSFCLQLLATQVHRVCKVCMVHNVACNHAPVVSIVCYPGDPSAIYIASVGRQTATAGLSRILHGT